MEKETYTLRYVEPDPERGQPAGAEYSVDSLADARKHHPRAMVAARVVTDARGNVIPRPFRGKQYWDRDEEAEEVPGEVLSVERVAEGADGPLPEIDASAYAEGATPLEDAPAAKPGGKRGKG
jgi:hypothetical protein